MGFLLKEDGSYLLQEDGGRIILDELVGAASFTVVARTKANILPQPVAGYSMKPVPTIGYAWATWPTTSNGASFAYYEIWRDGLDGGSVAQITDESVGYFADFTLPRNTPVTYHLRVVFAGGSVSSWVDAAPVTVPQAACIVTLAANGVPDEAFACQDAGPSHDFTFSAEDRIVIRDIYGREKPVGFRPGERGGDRFVRELFIAGLGANAIGAPSGRAVLALPLGLLQEPTVPYVALCDAQGWVWYTTPKVTAARFSNPGNVHTVTVAFAETADESSPVVTDLPWHF